MIKELLPTIDKQFNTITDRKGRFIGGISAGGYIALHNGLRHPDLFSKIGGHMPAIDLCYADEDECYFLDEAMWIKYDPISIACNSNITELQIYLDDGCEDEGHFYIACKHLYDVLKQKGFCVENHVFDGHHNSEYVMSNLNKYLEFYCK